MQQRSTPYVVLQHLAYHHQRSGFPSHASLLDGTTGHGLSIGTRKAAALLIASGKYNLSGMDGVICSVETLVAICEP
jgi:hypothetical protein